LHLFSPLRTIHSTQIGVLRYLSRYIKSSTLADLGGGRGTITATSTAAAAAAAVVVVVVVVVVVALIHGLLLVSKLSHVQLFKKEEQNFVFANEIDNMALIMPSQDKHAAVAAPVQGKAESEKRGKGKRRSPKKMEMTASLNVACLKRLLPIGLNMFGGREQELIQQAKQMLIDVNVSHILRHYQYNSNTSTRLPSKLRPTTRKCVHAWSVRVT